MASDIKKKLKRERNRTYVARDFDGFRNDLLRYAKVYFPDKIQDFSEASVGGLFLDLAAFVGDSMSFYLDHQFHELNWATATETRNIERHVRSAGVKIVGASPASVDVRFYIEVPAAASTSTGDMVPDPTALPIIRDGSTVHGGAVTFTLTEDLDFAEVDVNDDYIAKITVSETDGDGNPSKYIFYRTGLCVSGRYSQQKFTIPNTHLPFRRLTLSNADVSEIVFVRDAAGNTYYEVESLTHDTVYKGILNLDEDNNLVKENLEVIPAPYRFTAEVDSRTRLTTLVFGGGDADTLDDDIIPDPSELALPLYGKATFSRFSIDPNSLLKTQTLGIAPKATQLTVQYRHGGGLSHNVGAEVVRTPGTMLVEFIRYPTAEIASNVRASLDVINPDPASGGMAPPTIEELRLKIPAARNEQSRIVTKEDLLARVYTLPARFGRVYRAGVKPNPDNPLGSILYLVGLDRNSRLTTSPDALKKNLRVYLNDLRLISEGIDILDAQIVNYGIEFSISCDPSANRSAVVASCISAIANVTNVKNAQIGQPILESDITNVIINTPDVISLIDLQFTNKTGTEEDRIYSDNSHDMEENSTHGLIVPPDGGIFELKYADYDIIGSAL